MIKSNSQKNKTDAYKQALEKEGYEKNVSFDDSGKMSVKYSKPKAEKADKQSIKERMFAIMGYDKMSPDQLREAMASDAGLRSIMGVKEDTVKPMTSVTKISKTQKGIKTLDDFITSQVEAGEDEAALIKQNIVDDFDALKNEGYDMKQIVKKFAPKLSQYGLRDELPEQYRQYVTDIPAAAPSKKFNWGNVLSPVNVGANIQMR